MVIYSAMNELLKEAYDKENDYYCFGIVDLDDGSYNENNTGELNIPNIGKCKLCIMPNEGDNIPHFHIVVDNVAITYICLNSIQYFDHGTSFKVLNSRQRKALNAFLNEPYNSNIYNYTRWEFMCYTWNNTKNNNNYNFRKDQPDYTRLNGSITSKTIKKLKKRNPKTDYSFYEMVDNFIESTMNNIEFEKIKELNRYLNSFKANKYLVNGKIYNENNVDFSKYKTLKLSDMDNYKVGVCWDFVNYEANWFTENKIPFKTYMFVMQMSDNENDIITHTFLIFTFGNKRYWFESSWVKHQGIKEVKNYSDVIKELVKHYGKHPYSVYEYKWSRSLINISNKDFFDKTTQNLIKDVNITV